MDYILLVGPPAVGKATVAREVARLTGYRLVLNTLTAEMLLEVFARHEAPFGPLHVQFQQRILEEAARAGISLVSTVAWAFNEEMDWRVARSRIDLVRQTGGRVCIAELEAPAAVRMERNRLADRIAAKPRQAATLSEEVMRDLDSRFRLNSSPGELEEFGPYLRIDTTTALRRGRSHTHRSHLQPAALRLGPPARAPTRAPSTEHRAPGTKMLALMIDIPYTPPRWHSEAFSCSSQPIGRSSLPVCVP